MNLHGYQSLLPRTVGFDRLLSTLDEFDTLLSKNGGTAINAQTYPPYNVLKYTDDSYKIEIAVAGFSEDELDISVKENKLTITGSVKMVEESEYVHRGLAKRDFTHAFTLADTIVVKEAKLVNGLLNIILQNVIPEEKKPRKIEINKLSTVKVDQQLLIE